MLGIDPTMGKEMVACRSGLGGGMVENGSKRKKKNERAMGFRADSCSSLIRSGFQGMRE